MPYKMKIFFLKSIEKLKIKRLDLNQNAIVPSEKEEFWKRTNEY